MSNDLDMLEQVLKRSLRAGDLATTPQCLDAEALAAWEDGALDAAAMQIAEIHVSTCARCQSVLAVMAKGTTPATVPVVESNSFLSWHWWFAPMAAATAAVTLWMVVPEQQQQLATAPSSAVAPARDADLQEKAKGDTAPQQSAKNAIPAAEVRDVLKERVQAPTALPAAREDRRERQAASAANKEEAGKLVVQEPALAAADAAAPAATATAPPAPAPALSGAGALQKSARPAAAPLEIVSSDPQRRWRVVATGIEYSTDRGASWIPVRAIGTEVITGGMAPSGSICWLIGRAGAVLITVDGMIFAKVDLPVRVDVASIAATDARSAVVVTADGRTFRTDDSGRNWRQN